MLLCLSRASSIESRESDLNCRDLDTWHVQAEEVGMEPELDQPVSDCSGLHVVTAVVCKSCLQRLQQSCASISQVPPVQELLCMCLSCTVGSDVRCFSHKDQACCAAGCWKVADALLPLGAV